MLVGEGAGWVKASIIRKTPLVDARGRLALDRDGPGWPAAGAAEKITDGRLSGFESSLTGMAIKTYRGSCRCGNIRASASHGPMA